MTEVRTSLKDQQQGYCAYCEREIKQSVFIEHYIPQSTDHSQALKYDNLLGVCSGKLYRDKMTGEHVQCCSSSKASISLSINPRSQHHIDQICYENDASIGSNNANHDQDLDNTLNLNVSDFKDLRNKEYISSLNNLIAQVVT
jgi:uncharacterized protein (TIGR02646 family)